MLSALKAAVSNHKILWINILFGFLFLAFPVYVPVSRVMIAITLAAALLLFTRIFSDKGISFPIIFIVLGLFVIYMWTLAPKAPLPFSSLNRVFLLIPILLLFLVFVNYIKKADIEIWEDSIVTFVLVICVLETGFGVIWLLKWIDISKGLFPLPPIGFRLQGIILPGSNSASALANLVLPITIIRFFLARSRRAKWIWGFMLTLLLTVELFSSSRSGWISGLSAIATTIALFFYPIWSNRSPFRLLGQSIAWLSTNAAKALAGAFLITLIALAFFFQGQISPGHYGLLSGRDYIWSIAWQVWKSSPLIGHGVGSFPVFYANLAGLPPGWLAADAHNLWLNVIAEDGLIGLVFCLLVFSALATIVVRVWRAAKSDHEQRGRVSAYLGIGVGILVSSLAGFFFQIPIFAILCLLILSLFMNLDKAQGIPIGKLSSTLILAVSILLFGLNSLLIWNGNSSFARGSEFLFAGELSNGKEMICSSAELTPAITYYKFQCGFVAAQIFFRTHDRKALDQAIQVTKEGLALDPYWPIHRANLSIMEWQAGDRVTALSDMKEVVQKSPKNALFAVNLGWMAEQLGYQDLARASYRQSLSIDPWQSVSEFFRESELRHSVLRNFELPNDSIGLKIAAYISLQHSDLESASEYLDRALQINPMDAEAMAMQALIEMENGRQDAWFLAQKSIFLDPTNPRTLIWASQVARKMGEEEKANLFSQQAFSIWSKKAIYDTDTYYLTVYQPTPFETAYIPGYIRTDLSKEMTEEFLLLASNFQSAGEKAKAEEIMTALRLEGGGGNP